MRSSYLGIKLDDKIFWKSPSKINNHLRSIANLSLSITIAMMRMIVGMYMGTDVIIAVHKVG